MKYTSTEREVRIKELDELLSLSDKNINRLTKLNHEAKNLEQIKYVIYELLNILHHNFCGYKPKKEKRGK